MATVTKRYRIDGADEYTIEYRPVGSYLKIVAVGCPGDPYGNDSQTHHRYDSGEICVKPGYEPRTLDRAKAIASLWMKRYSRYIRTGRFDNSGGSVDV
ncbi:MAG: hypothetical protein HYX68_13890 [Planctomycetes bacterium]|nr:hypothetical protein [Planctomycetota bacterium]